MPMAPASLDTSAGSIPLERALESIVAANSRIQFTQLGLSRQQIEDVCGGEVGLARIQRRVNAFDEIEVLRLVDGPAQVRQIDVVLVAADPESIRLLMDEQRDVFAM